MENKWVKLANEESIMKTIQSLKANGISTELVKNREDAKNKVLSLIPQGVEVMNMTSVTLDALGVPQELEKDNYNTIRKEFAKMDSKSQKHQMKQMGAAPEYAIGSVHAITENGEILVASNTGSQLPAYAYGSDYVILVAGTQKIVKDLDAGMKRIYEHSLPLESERAKIAYGVPGSAINKILIINKEYPNRIHLILVPEVLGF